MLRLAVALATAAFVVVPTTAQAHPHDHQCAGFVDHFCWQWVPRGGTLVKVDCEIFFSGGGVVDTAGCYHP